MQFLFKCSYITECLELNYVNTLDMNALLLKMVDLFYDLYFCVI